MTRIKEIRSIRLFVNFVFQTAVSTYGLLCLAMLLAAGLRFWQLGSFPPGFYHDEAYNGLDAISLTEGATFPIYYEGWELYANDAHAERPPAPTRFPIFFEGNYGREPLHVYLMALSVWLFGKTPFAIRAVPAAAGVLGVLTTFLAARALFRYSVFGGRYAVDGERVGLFAAFFIAILYPAVHFSRFGLRVMLFVPVSTLCVWLFWSAVNWYSVFSGQYSVESSPPISNRQSSIVNPSIRLRTSLQFILAGFFLGLGIYTYAAARLFPLLFILFVPLWFWWQPEARRLWKQVGLMAGVSVLTAFPLLWFFFRYPYFFLFRIAFVAENGAGVVEGNRWLTWLYNAGRVGRAFIWQGETHFRHNLPGRPFLDAIQFGFAALGLFQTVRKPNPRTLFLWLWLLIMLLPSILSGDAPHHGRLIGAAPPLVILAGMGAAWLFDFSPRSARRTRRKERKKIPASALSALSVVNLRQSLLIAAIIASGLWTAYDYFGRYGSHPLIAVDFYWPDWELGQLAAAQREETAVFLTPTQEEMATIYFALGGDPNRIGSFAPSGTLLPRGGQETLYFVRPEAAMVSEQIVRQFGVIETVAETADYAALRVAAEDEVDLGEKAADFLFGDLIRLESYTVEQQAGQLVVTLVWETVGEMTRDYTAFVHLMDEKGSVVSQQDRQPAGYPTRDWRVGERVVDVFAVPLGEERPLAGLTVQTGFYYLPTLERLGESYQLSFFEQ